LCVKAPWLECDSPPFDFFQREARILGFSSVFVLEMDEMNEVLPQESDPISPRVNEIYIAQVQFVPSKHFLERGEL
jgi:hypothetical protein